MIFLRPYPPLAANMRLSAREIEDIYLSVAREYNLTPLAVTDGYVYKPSQPDLRVINAIAKYLPDTGGSVLDIGTGMGIAARCSRRFGARVISVDSLAASGTAAIENVKLAGVDAFSCDVEREKLPAESNSIDCVVFTDVIEHLIHSPKPVLMEIFRVLKPGGVCIATTPNAMRLTVRLRVLFGFTNWANIHQYFDDINHYGHHHEYTIDEFKWVFERIGFRLDDFILEENSLRSVPVSRMDDIKTQNRSQTKAVDEPLAMSALKKMLLLLTTMVPTLRSGMLLCAVKPQATGEKLRH